MERHTNLQRRCMMAVAALNVELGWNLDSEAHRAYNAALHRYLPDQCSDQQLRLVALHYHHDHLVVQVLQDHQHAQHDRVWADWMAQVIPILRHAGLAWSSDSAIDIDDLAQVARAELARSLPSFRYASRFSTWAHQVIVRSIQRYIRDRQALKRAEHTISLEQIRPEESAMLASEQPEEEAEAHVLAALIDRILSAQPDPRLTLIFWLWTQQDLRVEEIGQRVHLSSSQVRVLLQRIRTLLQQHPSITTWDDGQP